MAIAIILFVFFIGLGLYLNNKDIKPECLGPILSVPCFSIAGFLLIAILFNLQ
mgnify:CR=1 FL=1